jgi:hypothetical protein
MKLGRKIQRKAVSKLAQHIDIQDLLKDKSREIRCGKHSPVVYIAAMPKSAGTFISKTIAQKHNIPYLHYSDRMGCCEFDIYHPDLLQKIKQGGIVHQHTLGTEGNIHYLNSYKIPCVVLIRYLYDALFSFYEHLETYHNQWPLFEYPSGYFEWEFEKKMDFIIAMVGPWFFQFYVSWYRAEKNKSIELTWIRYEVFLENNISVINTVESLLKIDPAHFSQAVDIGNTVKEYRYNKGINGRGKEHLLNTHIEQIKKMAFFYPDVDFSVVLDN